MYGGTKSEMERLLKDAGDMAGKKFDLSNYADIVEAIHVVQDRMGIAGATGAEAADTIEGSFKATKAAWENLITAMGTGNGGRFKKAMSGLKNSAKNLVHNVIPIVKNALSGIAEMITEIAPILIAEIPGLVRDVLPGLIQAAGSIIKAIAQALPGLMGAIFDTLTSLDWADIGSTIVGALGSIGSGIVGLFKSAKEKAKNVNWTELGSQLWTDFKTGVGDLVTNLKTWFDEAKAKLAGIDWVATGKVIWAGIKLGIGNLFNAFSELFGDGEDGAENGVDWNGLGSSIIGFVLDGMNGLGELVQSLFDNAKGTLAEIDWVRVGNDIKAKVAAGLTFLGNTFLTLFEGAAGEAADESTWTSAGESILTFIGDGLAGAIRLGSSLLDGISAAVDEFDWVRFGKDIRVKMVQGLVGLGKAFAALFGASATESDTPENQSAFEQLGSSFAGAVETGMVSLGKLIAGFFGIDDAIHNISQWVEDIKQAFKPFTDWVTEIADKIASWFNLPDGIKKLLGIDEGGGTTSGAGGAGGSWSEPREGEYGGGQTNGKNGAGGRWEPPGLSEPFLIKLGIDADGLRALIDAAINNGQDFITLGDDNVEVSYLQTILDGLQTDTQTAISTGAEAATSEAFGIDLDPDTQQAKRDIQNALDGETFTVRVKGNYGGGSTSGEGGSGGRWARGMSGGRILKGATIFGVDGAGRPQIGGEAGAEAVVGVNSLGAMIRDSVRSSMGGVMGSMAAILSQMQSNNGMVMQLDSGALVGALVRDIDAGLGDLSLYRNGVRA